MSRKRAKKSEDDSAKLKILAGALLVVKALIELATLIIGKLTKQAHGRERAQALPALPSV